MGQTEQFFELPHRFAYEKYFFRVSMEDFEYCRRSPFMAPRRRRRSSYKKDWCAIGQIDVS